MLIPYILYLHRTVLLSTMQKLQSKYSRWEKIMLEASQQCGRTQLPTLVVDEPLSNVLNIESESLKLVAYENEAGYSIKDALKAVNS